MEGDRHSVGSMVPRGAKLAQFRQGAEIPKNAVLISRSNMLDVMYRRIDKWEPRSEIWPLSYGLGMIGGAAALNGIMYNLNMRTALNLRNLAPLMTFAPVVVIPCFTTVIVHQSLVTVPILLREVRCPLCSELRAATIQGFIGSIQPCLISIFACAIVARHKYTAQVPPMTQPKRLFEFFGKILKRTRGQALGLAALNIGIAMFVTQEEAKAAVKIHQDVET